MKKFLYGLALSAVVSSAFAVPTCPSIADVQATVMDFVLAAGPNAPIPAQSDVYNVYATLGHMHGDNGNWYVVDGAFTNFQTNSQALSVGQAYLSNAHEPTLYHDKEQSNIYACVYFYDEQGGDEGAPTFIVAANGSIDELKMPGGVNRLLTSIK